MADGALVDRVTSAAAGGQPSMLVTGPSAERALRVLDAAAQGLREKLGVEPAVELRGEEGEWRPTSWSQASAWLERTSVDIGEQAADLAVSRLLHYLDERQLGLEGVALVETTRTFTAWHKARALNTPPTTAQRRRARHLCRVQGPPPTSIIIYAKEDA